MKITRLEIETAKRLVYRIVEDAMKAYSKRNPMVNDLTSKERAAILREDKRFFDYVIDQAAKCDKDRYGINVSTYDGSPALKEAVNLIGARNRDLASDAKATKERLTKIGTNTIDECILSGMDALMTMQCVKARMEREL